MRKAVDDWNAVVQRALGVLAFRTVEREADAVVVITFLSRNGRRLMGETRVAADATCIIELPVRIDPWRAP